MNPLMAFALGALSMLVALMAWGVAMLWYLDRAPESEEDGGV